MRETFTIGELAERVAGGNERAMRKMLNDARPPGEACLNELVSDPEETVSRDHVIALAVHRVADRVGRAVAALLEETRG